MTILRKLSMKVTDFVMRHASSGSREWAEGLAREVEFIDNDWTAVLWAIGSFRVLLDRRETAIYAMSDVPSAARYHVQRQATGLIPLNILLLSQAIIGGFGLQICPNGARHEDSIFLSIAALAMSVVLFFVRRPKPMPLGGDVQAWALYYMTELARQRSWTTLCAIFVSFLLFFLGSIQSLNSGFQGNTIVSRLLLLAFAAIFILMLWRRRQDQRRIEQLERLMAQRV